MDLATIPPSPPPPVSKCPLGPVKPGTEHYLCPISEVVKKVDEELSVSALSTLQRRLAQGEVYRGGCPCSVLRKHRRAGVSPGRLKQQWQTVMGQPCSQSSGPSHVPPQVCGTPHRLPIWLPQVSEFQGLLFCSCLLLQVLGSMSSVSFVSRVSQRKCVEIKTANFQKLCCLMFSSENGVLFLLPNTHW